MKYTPESVRAAGLIPYAVYGGVVHSFKAPSTGDYVWDADLLDGIFTEAMNEAAGAINKINEA